MTNPELSNHIIEQGRTLVRAIEALGTIKPSVRWRGFCWRDTSAVCVQALWMSKN